MGKVSIENFIMGLKMPEPHIYEITVRSNDPIEPEKKVRLQIDYVLQKNDSTL